MQETLANRKIGYLEIPAQDVARSSGFYGTVFGWRLRRRAVARRRGRAVARAMSFARRCVVPGRPHPLGEERQDSSQPINAGASGRRRAASAAPPASSFATLQCSSLGRTATSNVSFATSTPTHTAHSLIASPAGWALVAPRPCLMRALGPSQLFERSTSDGDGRRPGERTVSQTLGAAGYRPSQLAHS